MRIKKYKAVQEHRTPRMLRITILTVKPSLDCGGPTPLLNFDFLTRISQEVRKNGLRCRRKNTKRINGFIIQMFRRIAVYLYNLSYTMRITLNSQSGGHQVQARTAGHRGRLLHGIRRPAESVICAGQGSL